MGAGAGAALPFGGSGAGAAAGAVSGGCLGTHVLLPDLVLLRRHDEVTVIGIAIERKVAGEGYRRIAERLRVPADATATREWVASLAPARPA